MGEDRREHDDSALYTVIEEAVDDDRAGAHHQYQDDDGIGIEFIEENESDDIKKSRQVQHERENRNNAAPVSAEKSSAKEDASECDDRPPHCIKIRQVRQKAIVHDLVDGGGNCKQHNYQSHRANGLSQKDFSN